MEINLIELQDSCLAEIISDEMIINNPQDSLDLLGNCGYQGAEGIIIHEKNITPDFFDLKTGLAGEILQKFSTYQMKLAIVGDFTKYASKSLKDFIYESNKVRRINFVNSVDEAKEVLAKN